MAVPKVHKQFSIELDENEFRELKDVHLFVKDYF
jgi:hypothetical protein